MHNTSSYVKMDAVKVRAMCEDVIKRIDKSRNEAKTDYVNERLRKIRKSWWRKLWKKPVPSFEEVMAEEKREQQRPGNFNHPFWNFEFMYGNQYATAKRLLTACDQGNEIWVSGEDLYYIHY